MPGQRSRQLCMIMMNSAVLGSSFSMNLIWILTPPPGTVPPGKALEAVDYKLYKWPGHGLSLKTSSYQCVEGEYMKADEYDALIKDPSNFWMRVYMPRIFGAFEPFRKLPPFTNMDEIVNTSFVPYGSPDVQAAFNALL